MEQYINKSALIAKVERLNEFWHLSKSASGQAFIESLLSFLDTFEVKDPYEQCVQYDSIKAGIQAHAETYSFNIESQLFPQLTKEQQTLWRKEIEQAVISGGDAGVTLARDQRYKENFEVKEVDLENSMVCKVDWLKSLKDKGQPQNRWKPSGEQISCLARAINRCPSRTDEKILGELLKQLNKQASE